MQKKKVVSMEQDSSKKTDFMELPFSDFTPAIEMLKQLSKFFPLAGALGSQDSSLFKSSKFIQLALANATKAEEKARENLAKAIVTGDAAVIKVATDELALATKEKKEKSPPSLEDIQVVILSVLNRSLTLNQLAPAIEAHDIVPGDFLGKGTFGIVTVRDDNTVCKEVRMAIEFDRKDASDTERKIKDQCQALQYLVREFYFLSQIYPKIGLCPKPERMEIRIVPAQGTEKAYISVGLIMAKMDGTLSDILAPLNSVENTERLINTLALKFSKKETEIISSMETLTFGVPLSEGSAHLRQLRRTPSGRNLFLGRAIVKALMNPIPE